MIVHVPEVLTKDQVAHCRAVMDKAAWIDGNATSGHQARRAKNNMQLPEESAANKELGEMVVRALQSKSSVLLRGAAPHDLSAFVQSL